MPRGRAVARTALTVLALALPGQAARAQTETVARAPSFDSLDVLRRAREAVRDFERTRRANAPPVEAGRYCDVRIGAYCYRYPPPGNDLPPEPARTDGARADLLDVLADAARALPGDEWIAGQRVRYLVEHGRPAAAVAAARECLAARWWCTALEGFARHMDEEDLAADSLFTQALAAMPPGQRCAWTDLSALLGNRAGSYDKIPCQAREGANRRVWWLARPLYTRPGDDLRAEHYSRHVMARILASTSAGRVAEPGADLTELVVRYGWPIYWMRPVGRPGEPAGDLAGAMRSASWYFFAASGWPPTWALTQERPASLYAPRWVTRFDSVHDAQIARFRRGDSVVTIAGFDLSTDTALNQQIPRVRLAVGSDAASPVVVGPAVASTHGGVAVSSPDPPAIVSLEAVRETSRWAARLRTATADPTGWLTNPLSDILLVRADAATAAAVSPLTATALPGATVLAGRPVGIYWEWYEHPPRGTAVTVEARVARVSAAGAPDPLGRSECAPAGKSAMAVQWTETAGERPGGVGRAVALDLTRLEPGRYVIAVSMQAAGQEPARCTSRDIVLLRP